jgi:hypothetical protein
MTYEEAENFLEWELIALPGWKGFWFKDIKTNEVLVLTRRRYTRYSLGDM